MVWLNACIDTVNNIIWAPLSHQLTTSVKLKNLQYGQTMSDACAIITEQEAVIPAYSKSVSVCLNTQPGQTLNSKLGFFQPSGLVIPNCFVDRVWKGIIEKSLLSGGGVLV